jgi:oligosaccharide repeat unit polymerase
VRIVCLLLLISLHWAYWKAISRLRWRRLALTPAMGWMAGLGYFLLAPLTLLVLNDGYTQPALYQANDKYASLNLSDGTYVLPIMVIWLALLFTFLAVVALTPKYPDGQEDLQPLVFNEKKLKLALRVTWGIALLDYGIAICLSGGVTAFLVTHWYTRGSDYFARFGDRYVLYTQLSQANFVVFTAAAALYTALMLQRRKFNWGFLAFIAFAMMLQMVMSGNRIFVALYGLSFLASCWIYGRKKIIPILLALSPLVLVFFSAWAALRGDLGTLSEKLPSYAEQDLGNRAMTTLMDTTEGASVMLFLHMVNDFGTKFDYFYGLSYTKAVTFIVPRSVYPSKPPNFPVLMAALYEPGEETSLGGTQMAELYGNFGVLSVLLLPVITVVILLLSERVIRNIEKHALVSAVLFVLCIWFARSSFEDNFVTFLLAQVLIWCLRLEQVCVPRVSPNPA